MDMKTMSLNPRIRSAALALTLSSLSIACSSAPPAAERANAENWAVTVWGQRYEIFPEVQSLVAGEVAIAHTHVTVLEDFSPMREGRAEIVLRSGAAEQRFATENPIRPGIFNLEIRPEVAGEYDLIFIISTPTGREELVGGRVMVGTAAQPGSIIRAATPPGGEDGDEPLTFLKEQQWRTDFATAWVKIGNLARSVEGPARVRPPAGGEATISAPIDAVLLSDPWPYPGRAVRRGDALLRLVPRVSSDRSLAALEAERGTLEAELRMATARFERLEDLYELEATSQRELEEAAGRVERLAGRLGASERDLEAAHASREGGSAGATTLAAPFDGEVAAVHASPGDVVAAGAILARLVRTDSVWLEVAIPPEATHRLKHGVSGVVMTFPEGTSLRLDAGVRLVSTAPEVDSGTGTVTVRLAAPPAEELILGTTASAQILLGERAEGIVVPTSALVGDGGLTVVYLQVSGEEFTRRPVRIVARQGDRAMVEGLIVGQRLVTRGGESIRRSSLLAAGEVQGHVH